MFQKSIQGKITEIVKRYANAYNKFMKNQCNPYITEKYLQYLDANKLCKWEMDPKTTNTLVWMEKESQWFFPWEKQMSRWKKNKEGYILEVDIKYPKELHKTHDKRPF